MKILIRGLVVGGLCAELAFAAGDSASPIGAGGATVPTSNGTTRSTNPSGFGGSNTPPAPFGGVGTGNVSKTTPSLHSQTNQDYQNTVRLYGANSDQARAALARQNAAATSQSRSGLTDTTGQTFPANGTFTPDINSGAGAAAMSSAGTAMGTGTGNAASTNGSPVAH